MQCHWNDSSSSLTWYRFKIIIVLRNFRKCHFRETLFCSVGTPKSSLNIDTLCDIACQEAEVYKHHKLVLLMIVSNKFLIFCN